MKYLNILLLLFIVACSSEDDSDYQYNDPSIYTEKVQFKEIIAFISPYITDNGVKKYIVDESLQNISGKVNGKNWTLESTYKLDATHIKNKENIGKYIVTVEEITYPIVVDLRVKNENLNTIGDYANVLDHYFILEPGTYVCQIDSFELKSEKIYTPTIVVPLEVKENHSSSNIGKFNIEIQQ